VAWFLAWRWTRVFRVRGEPAEVPKVPQGPLTPRVVPRRVRENVPRRRIEGPVAVQRRHSQPAAERRCAPLDAMGFLKGGRDVGHDDGDRAARARKSEGRYASEHRLAAPRRRHDEPRRTGRDVDVVSEWRIGFADVDLR
jgi:hypothetical protein